MVEDLRHLTIRPKWLSPAEVMVLQRWDKINRFRGAFKDSDEGDVFDPEAFMSDVTKGWKERFEYRERTIDTLSPFELVNYLLALMLEQGEQWTPQKRGAVRRTTIGLAQQSIEAMTLKQQRIFRNTILFDHSLLQEIGQPSKQEQDAVDRWIDYTVRRRTRK